MDRSAMKSDVAHTITFTSRASNLSLTLTWTHTLPAQCCQPCYWFPRIFTNVPECKMQTRLVKSNEQIYLPVLSETREVDILQVRPLATLFAPVSCFQRPCYLVYSVHLQDPPLHGDSRLINFIVTGVVTNVFC